MSSAKSPQSQSDTRSSSASTADQLQNKSIPSNQNVCGRSRASADSTMSTIPPSTPPRILTTANPYNSDGSPIQPFNSTPISGPESFSGGSPWGLSYADTPSSSSSSPPSPMSPPPFQSLPSQPSPAPPSPMPPPPFQILPSQPSPQGGASPGVGNTFTPPQGGTPSSGWGNTITPPRIGGAPAWDNNTPPQGGGGPAWNNTFTPPRIGGAPAWDNPVTSPQGGTPSPGWGNTITPPRIGGAPAWDYASPQGGGSRGSGNTFTPPQGGGSPGFGNTFTPPQGGAPAWNATYGITPLGNDYTGEGSESNAFASKYIQQTYTLNGTEDPTFATAPLPATNFSYGPAPPRMNFSVPLPGQRLPPPPNQFNPQAAPVAAGNGGNGGNMTMSTISTIPPQSPPNYYGRDGSPQGPMNSTPINGAEYYSGNAWSPSIFPGPNRMNFTQESGPRVGTPVGMNIAGPSADRSLPLAGNNFFVNRSAPACLYQNASIGSGSGCCSSGPMQGTRSSLQGDSMGNTTMGSSLRAEAESFGSGVSRYTDDCCCRCNKRGMGFDNTQNMDVTGNSARSEGWQDMMNNTQSQNGGSCCRPATPGPFVSACSSPGSAAGQNPNARNMNVNLSFPRNHVRLHLPNQQKPNNSC